MADSAEVFGSERAAPVGDEADVPGVGIDGVELAECLGKESEIDEGSAAGHESVVGFSFEDEAAFRCPGLLEKGLKLVAVTSVPADAGCVRRVDIKGAPGCEFNVVVVASGAEKDDLHSGKGVVAE